MLRTVTLSSNMLSRTRRGGLRIHDERRGAGGGLGVFAWGGVCGRLGGSGMSGDAVFGRAGGVTVDLPLALGKCVLSPSS